MNSNKILIDEDEQSIDILKWVNILLSNWLLILSFILVALFSAFLINKISIPQYQVSTTLLVKESQNPLDKFETTPYTNLITENQLNNEIGTLKSNALINRTIKQQNLWIEYSCQEKGILKKVSFDCPFDIEFDKYHPQLLNTEFSVEFNSDSTFQLSANSDNAILYDYQNHFVLKKVGSILYNSENKITESILDENFRFVLIPKKEISSDVFKNKRFIFTFYSLNQLKNKYSNFEVQNVRNSSILEITYRSNNKERAVLFLNKLLDEYLLKEVERENLIAVNTIKFIDNQLVTITDSLSLSEQQLESFRKQNKLLNIDFQAQQAFEKMETLQNEKNLLLVKIRYIDYLKNSLITENEQIENLILPSTLNITDQVLNNLVHELVVLFKEYSELSLNSLKNNPYLTSLEQKIGYTKSKLFETIENISNITQLSIENNAQQISEVESLIHKLPQDQRKLFNIERKFQLNDELYTYLLTKRSEMQIMKAANLPKNEILDRAVISESKLVFPNKKMNYILAILIGMSLPIILIWAYTVINQKIRNFEDIQQLTKYPVIAHIFNDSSPNTLEKDSQSAIQESLRTLRANLQFVIDEEQPNILMVSSAIPSEGKSYISTNLANIYTLFNKKVLLVDFDLRKAKLSKSFNVRNEKGISTFLSNKYSLKEIIHSVENGFDILPTGSIPPNPGALIASEKTKLLLEDLKKDYDIIVIDTPPIGVVSDALFLSKIVNQVLFVTRYNVSPTPLLNHVFRELEKKNVENLGVVFNAVPNKKRSYGYSYGYGYGYGYFKKESNIKQKYKQLISHGNISKKGNGVT